MTQIYVLFNMSAYLPVREYVDHLAILQSRVLGPPSHPEAATTTQRSTCSHTVMPLGRAPPCLITMATCP